MTTRIRKTIEVQGTPITVLSREGEDFISLTDMVKNFEGGDALIEQWLRSKDTILFLGIWEQLNNPGFNSLEFEGIRDEAGRSSFYLSARRWITATGARGLTSATGRHGGTFAHRDIAFEFGSWLSPEFKLYLITQFQQLKGDESHRLSQAWNLSRTLSRLNYRMLGEAIKAKLVPPSVTPDQAVSIYKSEADLLNVALFGESAEEWREAHPELAGHHAGLREHRAAARAGRPGEPERRIHPDGPAAGGAAEAAQRDRDPADVGPRGRRRAAPRRAAGDRGGVTAGGRRAECGRGPAPEE